VIVAMELNAQVHPKAIIPIGEQLVADGIPPLPTTLVDELQPYTEARGATFLSWHPVRAEMLISTRFANTPQLHRVAFPGGARRQLTYGADAVVSGLFVPGDGSRLIYSRDKGGDEFAQLHELDLGTGKSRILTDGGRTQNGGVVWNRAKTAFAYTSTRRNGADRDIWVMSSGAERSNRLAVTLQGGGWSVGDWSPGDARLVVSEYLSASRGALWIADAVSGVLSRITPPEPEAVWRSPRFARDGATIFCITDIGGEFQQLAALDTATGKSELLTTAIPWDVEAFELSPDERWIAFVTNENGFSKLYLMETATRQYAAVDTVPPGVLTGLEWHPVLPLIGFTLASSRSTADAYSIDVQTRAVTRWTESELGGMAPEQLSVPELVTWKSFDGRTISGFLYHAHPRFTGKRPVMINIHGGPEGQSLPTFIGSYNYFLNELGVSVLFPNVRGSTGFGRTFQRLDNVFLREDSVRDISALLDWLPSQARLDPDRVMVIGGSYGGYMSLAVSVAESARIRCAVDIVGISHFGTFLKNTESYRRDLRRAEYGDERDPKVSEFFERISPLNNAARIKKPLFVVQGANDPRVPQSEAEQIVAKVKGEGTPVWYLLAKDEGHGFRKKNNRDYLLYAQALFVRRYLLGEE
jgi:dipeptidyl aminopeptidase/acylaminoacyl peptidase